MNRIKIFLIATSLFYNCSAGFSFSNKTSQIKVSANSTFTIETPITSFNGTLAIDSGGTVTGDTIQFNDGVLADTQSQSGAVEGTFERDFATMSTDNLKLDGNKSIFINGDVRGSVNVSGLSNKISGTPKFNSPITLSNLVPTALDMAITTDCDANIVLNGQSLSLGANLVLASGVSITSTSAVGSIYLNNSTLSLGAVTGNWADELVWHGEGGIQLYSTATVENSWEINGKVTITGNGNSLDISHANAQIVIAANSTLRLNDITLKGVDNDSLVFTDATSKLELVNANLALKGNFLQTTGQLHTVAESKILMTSTPFSWIISGAGTFTDNGTTLWLDTGINDTPAVFGFQGILFASYVDHDSVKQVVDFEKVRDVSIRYLVSGNINQSTEIEASFFVQPDENLNFTGDAVITSNGVNINFSNTPEPQFIIAPNAEVTFTGNQTLSIYSNTMDIAPGGTLAVQGQTQIVINDGLLLPSGTIKVAPGGSLNLSGTGSGQRVGLSSIPGQPPAKIDIGFGEAVLSNMDFFGLENVITSNKFVNGVRKEGRILMGGNTRIHVIQDTDINFHIRGANNVLVLERNNIEFSGKITFDDDSDNVLEIRFELQNEDDLLQIYFAQDAMNLYSRNGTARLVFSDQDVQVFNKDIDSWIIAGRAFIDGYVLRITNNPFKQLTSDLTFGQTLTLLTSGSLLAATAQELNNNNLTFLTRRDPSFAKNFHFSNLAETEHYFINRSLLTRAPRRPNLRIPGSIDSRNTRGVLRLQRYGQLTNFGVDGVDELELQLSGNTKIKPPIRRIKRTVSNVRAINIPNFNDSEYTDRLKVNDKVYVSGQENRVVITGNFEIKGQIILDEKAELIFEFDDSIDTPKALKIATTLENGDKGIILPKSASLVFQGAGQVVFEDGFKVFFNGDAPNLSGASTFDDNRPSLIFKNYAEMAVDLEEEIIFQGNGQVLLQSNSSARVSNGHVLIGTDSDDHFNIGIDRQSNIKVGDFESTKQVSAFDAKARFSLGAGQFNLKFDRQSQLQIRNEGIFEIALDQGDYQDGHMEEFKFTDKSILDIGSGGRLAFGQSSFSDIGSLDSQFSWDNKESTLIGGGIIALYDSASTAPRLEALVQDVQFTLLDSSALTVAKSLTRVSNNAQFVNASDFIDADGNYKLLLSNNSIVSLVPGDVIRREGTTDLFFTDENGESFNLFGAVFGTAANGVRFAILPTGTRKILTGNI